MINNLPHVLPVSSRRDFFFSSRRRHTRLQGDWSSDVCSSDLRRARRIRNAGRRAPGRRGWSWRPQRPWRDRKSVVEGKSVDLGGRRIIKKKKFGWRIHAGLTVRKSKQQKPSLIVDAIVLPSGA